MRRRHIGTILGMTLFALFFVSASYGQLVCTGTMFDDVDEASVGLPFCHFIERFAALGITGGCSTTPPRYCPDSYVTRGQMAVFLTSALEGHGISGVTAGPGLIGGGTSGDVTLSVDTTQIQARVSSPCPPGQYMTQINANGTVDCAVGTSAPYSAGSGLSLSGTVFSLGSSYLDGSAYDSRFVNEGQADSVTSAMIANGTIGFADIGQNSCSTNQIMKWNGAAWGCAADDVGGSGTVTRVNSGAGLIGGPITTIGTLAVAVPLSLSASLGEPVIDATNTGTDGIGILGYATALSGATRGVYGRSDSSDGAGVYGDNRRITGPAYGVYGRTSSDGGIAVAGRANATSGATYGLYGRSDSTGGKGVYGEALAPSGFTYGLYAKSESPDGVGVYGAANATSGTTYGVHGEASSALGFGGLFNNTTATGVALKADGSGIIQNSALSSLWISGNGARPYRQSDTTIIDMDTVGGARIYRGASEGHKNVMIPISITGPLFGQNVTLTGLDIYWAGDTEFDAIAAVLLRRQTGVCATAACFVNVLYDSLDHTCEDAVSPTGCTLHYDLTSNNVLTADSGILYLTIELAFSGGTTWIDIGGIRLTLRHD